MQPPKSKICVICGVRPATTQDHVPPKGFLKGTTGQFRTVPACNECNNGSAEDDEALRNYISLQVGKQTESAKKLWEDGAHKSLKRSTKLRSALLKTMKEIDVINATGKNESRLSFWVPSSLYQQVFERVTRGLVFYHSGEILPPETIVKINLLNNPPDLSLPEIKMLEYQSISNGAFEYRFGFDPDTFCNSLWLFTVHGSHWVQSSTGVLSEE